MNIEDRNTISDIIKKYKEIKSSIESSLKNTTVSDNHINMICESLEMMNNVFAELSINIVKTKNNMKRSLNRKDPFVFSEEDSKQWETFALKMKDIEGKLSTAVHTLNNYKIKGNNSIKDYVLPVVGIVVGALSIVGSIAVLIISAPVSIFSIGALASFILGTTLTSVGVYSTNK